MEDMQEQVEQEAPLTGKLEILATHIANTALGLDEDKAGNIAVTISELYPSNMYAWKFMNSSAGWTLNKVGSSENVLYEKELEHTLRLARAKCAEKGCFLLLSDCKFSKVKSPEESTFKIRKN